MNNTTYNGRSNRETWLVGLHYEINTIEDMKNAKYHIEEIKENIEDYFLRDFMDFGKIDWNEIKNNLISK